MIRRVVRDVRGLCGVRMRVLMQIGLETRVCCVSRGLMVDGSVGRLGVLAR